MISDPKTHLLHDESLNVFNRKQTIYVTKVDISAMHFSARVFFLLILTLIVAMLIGGTITYAEEKYKFDIKWGSLGTGDGQFRRPHTTAIDSKRDAYVSDRDTSNERNL
ncbi:MAG: hypothetical protein ABJB85_12100 [Nitrososphaerota archaeon]